MTALPRRRFVACLSIALAPVLAAATEKKAGKKKTGTGKLKIIPADSTESAADRSRRFQRECRGQPNAGACAGYGYGS